MQTCFTPRLLVPLVDQQLHTLAVDAVEVDFACLFCLLVVPPAVFGRSNHSGEPFPAAHIALVFVACAYNYASEGVVLAPRRLVDYEISHVQVVGYSYVGVYASSSLLRPSIQTNYDHFAEFEQSLLKSWVHASLAFVTLHLLFALALFWSPAILRFFRFIFGFILPKHSLYALLQIKGLLLACCLLILTVLVRKLKSLSSSLADYFGLCVQVDKTCYS